MKDAEITPPGRPQSLISGLGRRLKASIEIGTLLVLAFLLAQQIYQRTDLQATAANEFTESTVADRPCATSASLVKPVSLRSAQPLEVQDQAGPAAVSAPVAASVVHGAIVPLQ